MKTNRDSNNGWVRVHQGTISKEVYPVKPLKLEDRIIVLGPNTDWENKLKVKLLEGLKL